MTVASTGPGRAAEHAEPPEVVAQRQLLGVWLFIAGDAVVVGSILFTYLYLRGLNTQKQWMPAGVHGASLVLTWGLVAVAGASAAAVWAAERGARRGTTTAVPAALVGVVLALVAAGLSAAALHAIPRAVNATSGVRQVAGTYASSLLAIDASNLLHLLVLALLGLAVAIRAARGRIGAAAWQQARLVRIFWVWVVLAIVISAAVTTVFVASPR